MSTETLVHIVDDDPAVRQSLAFLLASEGLPIKVYESADILLGAIAGGFGGCIVTDVRMPGTSGVDLLRRLKARGIDVPVIVMTGHADVALAVEAMKQGAVDFVEKPFDDDYFVGAVRAALAHGAERARAGQLAADVRARLATLSKREEQVLQRLIEGKPNKIVAHELKLSPRTVEIYRARVMTKMQAGSLPELVRMVLTVRP